jgi:hypothetical protein
MGEMVAMMRLLAAVSGVLTVGAMAAGAVPSAPGGPVPNAAPVSSYVAVVTNTSDAVNGNVSSIAALNARPGRDGISLREALEAADATKGSETVYIMFSSRLNGKTITPRSELPVIHRAHLVLEGVAPNGAAARVTLDARQAQLQPPDGSLGELLLVQASDVTVRWLRFTGLKQEPAVHVQAGSGSYRTITGVTIDDNVFDNMTSGAGGPVAGVMIGTYFNERPTAPRTYITGVNISRNTFSRFTVADAVGLWADNSGVTISGALITGNRFLQDTYPVELGTGRNGPLENGIQIIGNTITGGSIGISLNNTDTTNGKINGTLIEDNAISGVRGPAINLGAEIFVPGMGGKAYGDAITGTQIVNNVIRADYSGDAGIFMNGGDVSTPPHSMVSSVTIENDTFVNDSTGSLLDLVPNNPGGSGNDVTGVTVRNSILYEASGSSAVGAGGGEKPPGILMNSLVSGPGWAGKNGNITGDPGFVNEAAGDYHLTAASPCIKAGAASGAPAYDFDGGRRGTPPDIGAFEYGAAPRPLLTVTSELLGGTGTVKSSPAGISCGTACGARFNRGTAVTLTATASRQSRFLGWFGACHGTGRCSLTLDSPESVTARFAGRSRLPGLGGRGSGQEEELAAGVPGLADLERGLPLVQGERGRDRDRSDPPTGAVSRTRSTGPPLISVTRSTMPSPYVVT